jgi:cell division transport system permease protein
VRALRYAFDEAILSLWRGRQSGLLSTLTIALALFVLGAFLIVTANLERLGAEWSSAAEMSVYLTDDASIEERKTIEDLLKPGDLIASSEYVSKAEALVRFKRTFSDLATAVGTLGDNPLPASYEVRLRSGPATQSDVDNLGAKLRQTPGVADVRYDRQWIARVLSAIEIIRAVGLVLGLVLTFAAALTVANVVRLALFARRDELEIMQLVGAPAAFVHGPFVMEGVLQGGLGAVLALIGLVGAFVALRAQYLAPLVSASTVRFLPVELCALLVAGGMAVGCIGGAVAAWRA